MSPRVAPSDAPPRVQSDVSGRLVSLAAGSDAPRLIRLDPTRSDVATDEPLAGAWPSSFVVAAAGDIVASDGALLIRSDSGAITTWDADSARGDVWRGTDGHLHFTRPAAAPGTTELVRLDFGTTVAAVPTVAWTGAPAALRGYPVSLGGGLVFVQGRELHEITAPDQPPVSHPPLGFDWREFRASGAIWFAVGGDTQSAATGLVRWTRAGEEAIALDPSVLEIWAIAALSDDAVLAEVSDAALGRAIARIDASGAVVPLVIAGSPQLASFLPLR